MHHRIITFFSKINSNMTEREKRGRTQGDKKAIHRQSETNAKKTPKKQKMQEKGEKKSRKGKEKRREAFPPFAVSLATSSVVVCSSRKGADKHTPLMKTLQRFVDTASASKGDQGGAQQLLPSAVQDVDDSKTAGKSQTDLTARNLKLLFCFVGLQVSYVLWGINQEQLMTNEYKFGRFTSAAFCVFGNRFLALFISLAIVVFRRVRSTKQMKEAPYYYYAPSSLSNSLSSWAQYESLKFVSFPTQVLSKSCKLIPVMLVSVRAEWDACVCVSPPLVFRDPYSRVVAPRWACC